MVAGMGLRSGLVSGVVSLLLLLGVPCADAAPGWLAPIGVSEGPIAEDNGGGVWGGVAGEPHIALDARGDTVAIWRREDGTLEGGVNKYEVQAAFRPSGGAWQATETLSVPDGAGESADEATVAFDRRGDVFAVWDAYSSNVPNGDAHFRVRSAFRPVGGVWQAPVDLSPVEAPGGEHPSLAVDVQGDATVSWNRGAGPVQEAFRPAGDTWQGPVDLTQGSAAGDLSQVAFDKQGDALAIWQGGGGLQSAFMPAGGVWQPTATFGSELVAGSDFAINGRGDAVAVWASWTEGFLSHRVVLAAFRPAGGEWQVPVDLPEEIHGEDWRWEPYEPRVAIDEQGDAVVVWSREQGQNGVVSAFRPAGGYWQQPVDLTPTEESAVSPDVAFDDQGDAIAAWSGRNGVEASFKPAGEDWQAPVDIGHGGGPQVAFDEQGDAVAAWVGEHGVEAAGYAATGPALNDVSIPIEGTVGQPLTFSVSPFDVWSISGETSWSFGDGASASGTSVTHTYTATGTYEVTLRSADTLGNVTSTTGKVTIAPAPPTTTPSPSAPTSGPPASEPPTIGAASQSGSTWRESGKAPVGTTFSTSLNEQATMRFSFAHHVNGGMVGHKCVAQTAKNTGGKVCSRTVAAGVLSFMGHSGANKTFFQGRVVRSKKLKPGRYTLVITAINATGQRSSPKSLNFTIVG
jgi:hypothetical protein